MRQVTTNLASRSVHEIMLRAHRLSDLGTLLPFAGQEGMPIHFALLAGHAWHLTDPVSPSPFIC